MAAPTTIPRGSVGEQHEGGMGRGNAAPMPRPPKARTPAKAAAKAAVVTVIGAALPKGSAAARDLVPAALDMVAFFDRPINIIITITPGLAMALLAIVFLMVMGAYFIGKQTVAFRERPAVTREAGTGTEPPPSPAAGSSASRGAHPLVGAERGQQALLAHQCRVSGTQRRAAPRACAPRVRLLRTPHL